jgi:predicted component of type VI protein secretion system
MKTFDEHVWDLVHRDRISAVVVDNHHAYGIIQDKVETFWEQVRLAAARPDEDSDTMVLASLLSVAATVQLMAEGLALVPEQQTSDERHLQAEAKIEELQKFIRGLLGAMRRQCKGIAPEQRGTNRYAFEFNEGLLEELEQQLEDIG